MQTFSIVIVGGGAGGLELAVGLARNGHTDLLLVDKATTHIWKPRLHEVAAGCGPGEIDEVAYATLAEKWGFAFQQGSLADISVEDRTITLAAMSQDMNSQDTKLYSVPPRHIGYQALVLAIGGDTPDFGVEGVHEHAAMLDDVEGAKALFSQLSHRLLAHHAKSIDRPFQIVVAGSGATGIELAAHLKNDFRCTALAPHSDLPQVDVTILEGAEQILHGVDDAVRSAVNEQLEMAEVRVETGQQICKVMADAVETKSGQTFAADVTIWATGTSGPAIAGDVTALETNKKGQWKVRPTLQSTKSDAIFALGDCCTIIDGPAPTTAQAASEQAEHLIDALPRWLKNEPIDAFEFRNKGTLLSLGDGGAVGTVKSWFDTDISINGRMAHAAYRGLYHQHQFRILGPLKGAEEFAADLFERAAGPRLKVYG